MSQRLVGDSGRTIVLVADELLLGLSWTRQLQAIVARVQCWQLLRQTLVHPRQRSLAGTSLSNRFGPDEWKSDCVFTPPSDRLEGTEYGLQLMASDCCDAV
jgi:hypothetical protein